MNDTGFETKCIKEKNKKQSIHLIDWYGEMRWNIQDIKSIKPNWTDDQCHKFWEVNESKFTDRITELGWEVLDTLIQQENK